MSSYINSIANINLLSVDFRNKSEFLEFSFMPVIVNDKFNQILYGTNYSRLGFYGRVEKSFLKVHLKNSSLKIGRGDNADNLYPHISILDTGFYPSSDEITFKLKENNYIYELCIGELSNEKDIEGRLIKRNFGKHSLNILFNEKTSLEFGEMIIYTGVNRNFELVYMNPFIPFFLNGLEVERKDKNNDNDNSIIYLMFKSMFRDVKYYTEFIIDDFQVDNTGREHALGFKLGINRMKIFGLSWMLEFINIDKWTFLHHGNFTSWVNFGNPLISLWSR